MVLVVICPESEVCEYGRKERSGRQGKGGGGGGGRGGEEQPQGGGLLTSIGAETERRTENFQSVQLCRRGAGSRGSLPGFSDPDPVPSLWSPPSMIMIHPSCLLYVHILYQPESKLVTNLLLLLFLLILVSSSSTTAPSASSSYTSINIQY